MDPVKPTTTYQKFFPIIMLALLIYGCDKSNDPLPKPSPQEYYAVYYNLELTGSYDDLIVSYYKPGSVLETVSPTSFPWAQNFDNFVAGDSVYFHFSFNTQPNEAVGFNYAVSVNKDGSYIAGRSGSQNLNPGDTAINIHVEWLKVIGS